VPDEEAQQTITGSGAVGTVAVAGEVVRVAELRVTEQVVEGPVVEIPVAQTEETEEALGGMVEEAPEGTEQAVAVGAVAVKEGRAVEEVHKGHKHQRQARRRRKWARPSGKRMSDIAGGHSDAKGRPECRENAGSAIAVHSSRQRNVRQASKECCRKGAR
jgi:hypothetical protein